MRNSTLPDTANPNPQPSSAAADRPAGVVHDVTIRNFRSGDAAGFRALNEAWITRWFFLEPEDVVVLNDPESRILGHGGHILIAALRDEVVGCCALLPLPNRAMRLARMAVREDLRGMGIGRLLLESAIAKARTLQALRIRLETSTRLPGAIHLYQSVGFRRVEPNGEEAPMQRADTFMEMSLRYG
jgi:putative acetyltransferase